MTRIPENLCVPARRFRDDFVRLKYCKLERRRPKSCSRIVNLRVNRRGDDQEGLVTQKFCCKTPLLVSVTFIFLPSLVWVDTFELLAGSPFASLAFAESHS